MSQLKDAALMAFVDGELDDTQRQALEAAIAKDPALAREVERQRALRSQVRGAFAGVLDEPVPDRFLQMVSGKEETEEPLVLRPQIRRARPAAPRFGPIHWAAMAASLALGAALGLAPALVQPEPLAAEGGRLVARGMLADALSEQLAADPAGSVRIGLSFRNAQSDYCRTFTLTPERLGGLACRQGGDWVVRATAETAPAADGYRMASSATPPLVLSAAEAIIAGEPFDAAQEAAARSQGWAD